MINLVPDGEVETGRPYCRNDRVFVSSRFRSNGVWYQIELPAHMIQPSQVIGVTRTRPYFDSDREFA